MTLTVQAFDGLLLKGSPVWWQRAGSGVVVDDRARLVVRFETGAVERLFAEELELELCDNGLIHASWFLNDWLAKDEAAGSPQLHVLTSTERRKLRALTHNLWRRRPKNPRHAAEVLKRCITLVRGGNLEG